ncbi:MAG: Fe-S protein assembly co-chaperone HscB [Planctomycetes bacterium]|nr:Fe-S protein assembly co-chaperone HscB [Planctomycetota bacterium]
MATNAGDNASAVPAKCIACDRELNQAVVCDYCHALNPVSAPTDYFTLLGVPRRYDLDMAELRRRFLALNRHAHPDFHAGDSPEVAELALNVSSAVNDAWRTLSDPVGRAEYLLGLLGGPASAEDRSTPEGFLPEVAELQERIHDARADGDAATLGRLAGELDGRYRAMLETLGELYGRFDTTVGCEAVRQDELKRLRRHLNAISYIRKLISAAKG